MDVDGSDSDGELFAHSAYPPVQLPLDYTQHQKKHRIVTPSGKVVTAKTKVEAPDIKPVTLDTKPVIPDTSIAELKTGDAFSTDVTSKSDDRSHPSLVTSSNIQPSSVSASEVTAAEVFSHLDDPHAHMVLLQLPDTLPFTSGDQMEEGGEEAEEANSEEVRPSLGVVICVHPGAEGASLEFYCDVWEGKSYATSSEDNVTKHVICADWSRNIPKLCGGGQPNLTASELY